MKRIEIKSPAKINIGLNIISKRSDGYHNLQTLFYPIYDLYDVLTFEKADEFTFTSDNDELRNDNNNLIIKAVRLLEKTSGKKLNASINLEKKLPMGAGLGGGSSNAATTLISLNELFFLGIKYEQLIKLALELGSDVPFFLRTRPAIGTSRGEILNYIDIDIDKPVLIVNPGIHISTREAFGNITPGAPQDDYTKLPTGKFTELKQLKNWVTNDFEKYVFGEYEEIKKIKEKLYADGAEFALMSGTGSTVYGIFDKEEDAVRCKDSFPENYFTFVGIL